MLVNNVRDNNVQFGAYFKNNTLFKNTYKDVLRQVDSKILDDFTRKCPNHEIEILSVEASAYGNKAKSYTVFNNMTGGVYPVNVEKKENALNKIMERLVLLTNFDTAVFWKEHPLVDSFKKLTGVK
ncbi:MAG: hypothetical protein NC200_06110 [Candidatus Gastranaerophilales bacterium]|nr:hypothetical protein [Candidatus Gastranaerophilales bacterium]